MYSKIAFIVLALAFSAVSTETLLLRRRIKRLERSLRSIIKPVRNRMPLDVDSRRQISFTLDK